MADMQARRLRYGKILPKSLVVLECGGHDTAFESGGNVKKADVLYEFSSHPKSGVALRLPPHSKTLRAQRSYPPLHPSVQFPSNHADFV